jgi:hypothetical protein
MNYHSLSWHQLPLPSLTCAGDRSPGYGVSLVAETSTKALLSIELAAGQGQLPEELGKMADLARDYCFSAGINAILPAITPLHDQLKLGDVLVIPLSHHVCGRR